MGESVLTGPFPRVEGTLAFETQNAEDGYGCDWHPSLRTHEIMAEALVAELRDDLGW